MRLRGVAAAIAAIVLALVVLGMASGFLVDWAWFDSVGFFSVFRTIVLAKLGVFFGVWVVSDAALCISGMVALRRCGPRPPPAARPTPWGQPGAGATWSDIADSMTPRI